MIEDCFRKFVRRQVLFENSLFQCFAFHPEEYHLVTGGSNRKITYWETSTGVQIRALEASNSGSINGLDIDHTGDYLVTVSADKLVKVSLDRFSLQYWRRRSSRFSYGVSMKVMYIGSVLVMVVK